MTQSLHLVCPACGGINRVPVDKLAAAPRCGKCKSAIYSATPIDLTQANFQRFVTNNDIPVLVDFWAPWCGPCKMMAPIFQQAAAQLEPEIRLAKVNTEIEQGLAAQYQIRSIPTMAIFRQGKEIARQAGAMDLANLSRWVQQSIR